MKRTYQPSKIVRKRRHGFRARMATAGGRKVLARRLVPWAQEIVGLTDGGGTGPRPKNLRPKIERLKKRPDFLRAARGIRRVASGLTLELCPGPEEGNPGIRVGFTASRKIGNAVARNRARRRLRAVARQLLPLYGVAGNDYVLVARRETLTRPFGDLLGDLESALVLAHERLGAIPDGGHPQMNCVARLARGIGLVLLKAPIFFYRWFIGPLLPNVCRFTPSCSTYALESLDTHGPWRGTGLALRRILRCQPFTWLGGSSGFDPVPPAR